MSVKKFILSLILVFLGQTAFGAFVSNRDFLSVGHGARANAMGEAFVAVADDVTAIYWNPAGLTQLNEDEFAASYSDRFDGLADETQIHYARRGRSGIYGFAYAGSYVTDIPITRPLTAADISAIGTGTFVPEVQSTDDVMDHAFLFSYSRPLIPESRHSVGATGKIIYRDILGMVRGYGTAFDVGYHYRNYNDALRFGINAQNIASLTSFSGSLDNTNTKATATESQIPILKTGVAYEPTWKVLNGSLLLAMDGNFLTDFNLEDYRMGVEYTFGGMVALRGGKVFERQDDTSEDFSMGVGLKLAGFNLDFSFLSNELGDTIRGTFRVKIGGDYYAPGKYKAR